MAVANGSSSATDAAPPLQTAASHPHVQSSQSFPQQHSGLHFPSVVTAEAPGQQHQNQRQHTSATGVVSSVPKAGLDAEEEAEETLMVQLVAGGIAGGCASAITTPFDVVKTRLQTEGVGSARRYNENVVSERVTGEYASVWENCSLNLSFWPASLVVSF